MTTEFKLPDLGENVEQADVVNVLVSEGHVIQAGQNILELETDKAVVELPSPHGGRVTKVHVKTGDKVKVGDPILTVEEEAGAGASSGKGKAAADEEPADLPQEDKEERRVEAPSKSQVVAPEEPAGQKASRAAQEREAEEGAREEFKQKFETRETAEEVASSSAKSAEPDRPARPVPAGPATRRMARELGVDLRQVSGTGPGGRIVEEDIKNYVRQVQSRAMAGTLSSPEIPPLPDFAQWGPVERIAMGGIRRKTAENTSLAWRVAPHVTQFDSADITELEAARRRYQDSRGDEKGKITMTVLAIKAVVAGLKKFPQFNSSVDAAGGNLIFKRYYNIGIAVDTENGLLVPVIRNADRKSIAQLAIELEEAAELARQRKLSLASMQGGTFTITNLGGIGGTNFTPVVNYPEVAILGMARGSKQPVVRGEAVEVRNMLPLALSYDHRAIDGADGARFLRYIAQLFEDPMKLLLEG